MLSFRLKDVTRMPLLTGKELSANSGGGGCNPKKTERYHKFQIWDWFFSVFFGFFSIFFGFSILANFDWFNGFLLSGSFW